MNYNAFQIYKLEPKARVEHLIQHTSKSCKGLNSPISWTYWRIHWKIQLTWDEKIKAKVYANQQKSVPGAQTPLEQKY